MKVTEVEEVNRLDESLRNGRGGDRDPLEQSAGAWSAEGTTGRVAREDGTNVTALQVEDDGGGGLI